jgi:hypothetical protein
MRSLGTDASNGEPVRRISVDDGGDGSKVAE